jgi:glycosidase
MQAPHRRGPRPGVKLYFDIVLNHTGDVIRLQGTAHRTRTVYPFRGADGSRFDDVDYAGGDTFDHPTGGPCVLALQNL